MDDRAFDGRRAGPRKPILRVGFGFEQLGRWCLASPRLALAVALTALAIGAAGTSRLTFDDELYNLYRTDGRHYDRYAQLVELFPVVENQIILLFEGDAVATPQGLATLRDAALEIQFVDGVLGVMSMFSARSPPAEGRPPEPLVPVDIPTGPAFDAMLDRLVAHPVVGTKTLSANHRASLMIVSFDSAQDTVAAAVAVRDTAREMVEQAGPGGITMLATGSPLLRHEILEAIQRDQIVLNTVGIIVTITLCLLYFGHWRYVLIATTPGMAGVIWTLGGFGLAGQSINTLTNVLPTLVLVIAFADSLHMVHAVRRAVQQGGTGWQAARSAVDSVGPACAMTSITTTLVFATLAASPSPTISAFGLAGMWAAVTAFLAVLTVVPTLSALLLTASGSVAVRRADGVVARASRQVASATAGLVDRRPVTVALCGVTLLGVAVAGYASAEFRYGYRDFLPDRSDANRAIDRIDAIFGGADTVHVLIRRTEPASASGGLSGADVVRASHLVVDETPRFANAVSLKTLEDWLREDVSDWRARQDAGSLALPDHLAQRIESADGSAWLITAYLPVLDASRSIPLLDALDEALEPVRMAAPEFEITVTGLVPMTARASGELITTLNRSLVAAIGVTMLLIALTFRSIVLGLLAALPNLLPLAAAGSFLYLSGTGLQLTSVVALTIAFGIAVDDTIHLVHRWRHEAERASTREAVIEALRRVGPVLIATTFVLITGTAGTQASELSVVRLFGTLCMITFAAALVADLLLMPALMIVFSRVIPRPEMER